MGDGARHGTTSPAPYPHVVPSPAGKGQPGPGRSFRAANLPPSRPQSHNIVFYLGPPLLSCISPSSGFVLLPANHNFNMTVVRKPVKSNISSDSDKRPREEPRKGVNTGTTRTGCRSSTLCQPGFHSPPSPTWCPSRHPVLTGLSRYAPSLLPSGLTRCRVVLPTPCLPCAWPCFRHTCSPSIYDLETLLTLSNNGHATVSTSPPSSAGR